MISFERSFSRESLFLLERLRLANELGSQALNILSSLIPEQDGSVILALCPYEFVGRKQGGSIRTNNLFKVLSRDRVLVSISFSYSEFDGVYRVQAIGERWVHIDCKHLEPHGGRVLEGDCHFVNWYTPEMLILARKILDCYKVSHLWLEYSYMSTYCHLAYESDATLVLSLHNLEHKLVKEMQERVKKKYLHNYGSWEAVKILEDEVITLADKLIVTTDDDAEYCKEMAPRAEVYVAPNVINLDFDVTAPGHESKSPTVFNILFVGDGNYPPNEDGVQWLIEMVNELSSKNEDLKVFFTVIGRGTEKYSHQIKSGAPIECKGFVENLDKFYAIADACILPLRLGGGSRLKAYEAIEFCKPILTTKKGIEGISAKGLQNYIYYFEGSTQLLSAIFSILEDKKISRFAEMPKDYYSWYENQRQCFVSAVVDVLE